jgi:60 kDa SS-A/Ro ribonucleoprotein
MSNPYTTHLNRHTTPQTEPIPGREAEMAPNDAGGVTFILDPWAALRRFLILGTEGGTYYVGEKVHTKRAGKLLLECINADGPRVVKEITDISERGLAPRQDPGVFALAAAAKLGNGKTQEFAYDAMPTVCRTGYTLFMWLDSLKAFGGVTSGAQRALHRWYHGRTHDNLAYQLMKYRQRDGWTHRDALRLGHVDPMVKPVNRLFKWVVNGYGAWGRWHKKDPEQVKGFIAAQKAESSKAVAEFVVKFNLTREMIPTQYLNDPLVQEALFQRMPMTAMVRNLGNLSKPGLLKPLSGMENQVVERLTERDRIRKARLHPFSLLLALRTYASGRGLRGKGSWEVSQRVVDALEQAIELAWENVEPTGKAFMVGVDVSSSMTWSAHATANVMASEAAAMVALMIAKREQQYAIRGFSTEFKDLGFSASDSFRTAIEKTRRMSMGGTDCSVPVKYALEHGLFVDTFVVLTDCQTWAGDEHPSQALAKYRKVHNPNARLAVLAFTAGSQTIADPADAGMLDIVGLDASVPMILSAFAKGEV